MTEMEQSMEEKDTQMAQLNDQVLTFKEKLVQAQAQNMSQDDKLMLKNREFL